MGREHAATVGVGECHVLWRRRRHGPRRPPVASNEAVGSSGHVLLLLLLLGNWRWVLLRRGPEARDLVLPRTCVIHPSGMLVRRSGRGGGRVLGRGCCLSLSLGLSLSLSLSVSMSLGLSLSSWPKSRPRLCTPPRVGRVAACRC